MLIDEFMPTYDVMEHHETTVHASADHVYEIMLTTDMFGSPITRFLFYLRAIPLRFSHHNFPPMPHNISMKALLEAESLPLKFIALAENPPHEFLVGSIIRMQPVFAVQEPLPAPTEYCGFDASGAIKITMNLCVSENADGTTLLETETRVHCFGSKTRRRFRVYWFFIGHFSGLIRRLMLRAMKREAEVT